MRTTIGMAPIRHATPFERLTYLEQEAVKRCFPGRERFVYEVTGDHFWISSRDDSGGINIDRHEFRCADRSLLAEREREALRKFFPTGQLIAIRETEVVIMQPNGCRPETIYREYLRNHDVEAFSVRPAPEMGIAVGVVAFSIDE